MSCFGGLSPVLSNISHVLRLHCGSIVCAPGFPAQEGPDQAILSSSASAQDLTQGAATGPLKGVSSLLGASLALMRCDLAAPALSIQRHWHACYSQ